jgi:hypothetical protein
MVALSRSPCPPTGDQKDSHHSGAAEDFGSEKKPTLGSPVHADAEATTGKMLADAALAIRGDATHKRGSAGTSVSMVRAAEPNPDLHCPIYC